MKHLKNTLFILSLIPLTAYSQAEITFEKTQPLRVIGDINLNDSINNNVKFTKSTRPAQNAAKLPSWTAVVQHHEKDYQRIEQLLKNKQNVNAEVTDGQTLLILGAMQKDLEQVNLALKYKANINNTNKQGETALHWAVIDNDVTYRLLQENQKNKNPKNFLNKKNKDGRTALHFASTFTPGEDVIDLLINNGADIEAIDKDGRTPAFYAAAFEQWNALDSLLKRGANVQSEDKNKVSVEYLILRRANVANMIRFYPYLSLDSKQNIKDKIGKNYFN